MTDPGPGMPLWFKVFAVVAALVVVLFVVLLVAGGGEHGPGRHSGAGHPASSVGRTGAAA